MCKQKFDNAALLLYRFWRVRLLNLCLFLCVFELSVTFSRAETQIQFLPGGRKEALYLLDNHSYLVNNKERARVADGVMHWIYRLPLHRGDAEYLKLQIANQYLVSISTDNRTWKTAFDCSLLGQTPGELSLDITQEAALSSVVYLRFQDRYPSNGWGPYLTHLWLYDLGPAERFGPLMLDISQGWKSKNTDVNACAKTSVRFRNQVSALFSRRVVIPSGWAGMLIGIYFPGATAYAKIYWNDHLLGKVQSGEESTLPLTVARRISHGILSVSLTRLRGRFPVIWRPVRIGLIDMVSTPVPFRQFGRVEFPHERRFAPYNLAKLNWLSGNYLQSILDDRNDLLPFTTHENGRPSVFHYVEDTARVLVALADEERYTPVVRLQLAERLFHGLEAARLPGPDPVYSMKLDPQPLDIRPKKDDLFQVIYHQDLAEPVCLLSARFYSSERRIPLELIHSKGISTASPAVYLERCPSLPGTEAEFSYGSGRLLAAPYALVHFPVGAAARILVSGLTQSGQWFTPYTWGADTVKLPDSPAFGKGNTAPLSWKMPSFHWLLIRGDNTGDYTFSRALEVGWTGNPDRVSCIKEGVHIASVEVSYGASRARSARVWVIPFDDVSPSMHYPQTMALLLQKNNGYMNVKCFDPVRNLNRDYTICAGFAAAAYLFHKYRIPEYPHALRLAERTTDYYMALQTKGTQSNELYFPIAACQYLMLSGQPRYEAFLKIWGDRIVRMQAPDGAWPWFNFQLRNMIALLRAYDATHDKRYLASCQRALETIRIGRNKLYWRGKPASIEDAFDGALLLAVLGHQNELAQIPDIIHLADKGFLGDYGFCRCSDLDEYALGFSAKGLHLQREPKHILSLNQFAEYGARGVIIVNHPTAFVRNRRYPVTNAVFP